MIRTVLFLQTEIAQRAHLQQVRYYVYNISTELKFKNFKDIFLNENIKLLQDIMVSQVSLF